MVEARITAVDEPLAVKPCAGSISTRPLPRVRITRQPPRYVPSPMAAAQDSTTQNGVAAFSLCVPLAIRARVMMPIVFCASFVPCASDSSEAEPIWPSLKPRSFTRSETPEVIRKVSQVPTAATAIATSGARTAGMSTFATTPDIRTADAPPDTNAAPTTPPISACEELDGRPRYQVSRFQVMPPINPAKTTVSVTAELSTMPLAMVAATDRLRKAPTKLRIPDNATATLA